MGHGGGPRQGAAPAARVLCGAGADGPRHDGVAPAHARSGGGMADDGTPWDVVVVGGGPAGLAASLWLARYRHRVLCYDAEDPRNAPTWGVHGYLGLPEVPPLELRRIGRQQALTAGAVFEAAMVGRIEGEKDEWTVTTEDGRSVTTRRILLCTGLKDIVPEIPGLQECYGRSVWHCPDCDGPTAEGLRVGVLGWGRSIATYAMYMLTWTDRLTVLTHGHDPDMPPEAWAALERHGIPVERRVIDAIRHGPGGCMQGLSFHGGGEMELDMLFFHVACGPGSTLAADLGCEADEDGILAVTTDYETTVPGVYAAGDITPGSRLAIRAAGEGTRAAVGIHKSLIPADRRLR